MEEDIDEEVDNLIKRLKNVEEKSLNFEKNTKSFEQFNTENSEINSKLCKIDTLENIISEQEFKLEKITELENTIKQQNLKLNQQSEKIIRLENCETTKNENSKRGMNTVLGVYSNEKKTMHLRKNGHLMEGINEVMNNNLMSHSI